MISTQYTVTTNFLAKFKWLLMLGLSVGMLVCSCGDKPSTEKSTSSTVKKADQSKTKSNQKVSKRDNKIPKDQLRRAKEVIANASKESLAGVGGKKIYLASCASCHGSSGMLSMNGATKLKDAKGSLEENVAQIYHGKGMMTAFRGILKDDEIVAVAKFIEVLR